MPKPQTDAQLNAGLAILGTDTADFENCWKQFAHDPRAVFAFLDNAEEVQTPADLILEFALDRGAVECIDWSGEDDPDQLQTFVQRRLDVLGGPALDWSLVETFVSSWIGTNCSAAITS